MSSIEELANRAGTWISGIPWSSITKEAPQTDVYGKLQYYVPLAQEMRKVLEFSSQVDWTWDVIGRPDSEKATAAWYGVRTSILSRDSFITAALRVNASTLFGNEAPPFELEILRAFLSQMMSLAMRGFAIHRALLMQRANTDASVIVNNADSVHALCLSLSLLYRLGVMNPLLKKPGTALGNAAVSGGPVAPVVVGIIAIGAVAALSVMAWFLLKQNTIIAQWHLANKICKEAMENPTTEKLEACAKAQQYVSDTSNTLKTGGTPFSGAFSTLAVFAGIGIAGWFLLPQLKGLWGKGSD